MLHTLLPSAAPIADVLFHRFGVGGERVKLFTALEEIGALGRELRAHTCGALHRFWEFRRVGSGERYDRPAQIHMPSSIKAH